MFLAFLVPAASAACTISLSSPTDGSTVIDTPTFSWGGNCAQYRVQYSASGSFTTDTVSTAYQISRSYAMAGEDWDTRVAGWGASVRWRVEGLDSTGVSTLTLSRTLYLDPDQDDDTWSVSEGDCDDGSASVYPGAAEACDGLDQDCDSVADDGLTFDTWYLDADLDGYGTADSFVSTCDGAPAGYLADGTDCDDADGGVNPGLEEVCGDGVDQNCNGGSDGCAFEGNVAHATADIAVRGYRSYYHGTSMQLFDLNGDGALDLVAGSPSRTPGRYRGAVYAWFGPLDGTEVIGNADVRIDGLSNNTYFGSYLASAGDVNGDLFEDFVFTAVTYDAVGSAGRSFLFHGPIDGGTYNTGHAVATFSGYVSADYAYVVTAVGDLDGDGYGDLAFGAPAYDDNGSYTDSGWVDLWFGPVTGDWYTGEGDVSYYHDASSYLGHNVAAGDVDGDGYTDLVLGSPTETERVDTSGGSSAGTVRVCYGPDLWGGAVGEECPDGVMGARTGSYLGYGRAGSMRLADLDDDGAADLLVGSPYDGNAGSTYGSLYGCLGPFDGMRAATACELIVSGGSTTSTDLGWSTAVGDFDGDGVDDLAVGDPNGRSAVDTTTAGRVSLYFGPLATLGARTATDADATVYGTEASMQLGYQLDAGDVDGDGVDDLCVAAPFHNSSGLDAGSVLVWYGGSL